MSERIGSVDLARLTGFGRWAIRGKAKRGEIPGAEKGQRAWRFQVTPKLLRWIEANSLRVGSVGRKGRKGRRDYVPPRGFVSEREWQHALRDIAALAPRVKAITRCGSQLGHSRADEIREALGPLLRLCRQ